MDPKARNAALSSLRWLSMRSRDVAAIRSEESNFCALIVFPPAINRLRIDRRRGRAASVKNPSGVQPVLAQLLDERRAAHVQKARGLRHRAVGLFEGLADESDLDRRQMIL